MRHLVWVSALLVTVVSAAAAPSAAVRARPDVAERPRLSGWGVDWGPFYSRYEDSRGATRTRLAGPVWETRREGTNSLVAIRPFFTRQQQGSGWEFHDLIWPLGTGSRIGHNSDWRFLIAFYNDFDRFNPKGAYRFMILPFYFQGRNREGRPFVAVVPFGGRICDFVFHDRIDFVLFPVWSKLYSRGVETENWFFPFYAYTEHPMEKRRRYFPFYGYRQIKDTYRKTMILWPFWYEAWWSYPRATGTAYMLFPFYGRVKLSGESTHHILFPFFRFTHSSKLDCIRCPWPFVQIEKGARNRRYYWPVYGWKELKGRYYRFVAWPIYHEFHLDRGHHEVRSWQVLPFLYSETERVHPRAVPEGKTPEVTARRFEVWPLASWQRNGTDRQFRMPDIWPGQDPQGFTRTWAPMFTLLDFEAHGENSDFELLWGLYRHQERGEKASRTSLFPLVEWARDDREGGASTRSWSVLKGLIGRERRNGESRMRLLYFIRW